MNVKEAVKLAKDHILDLFGDEQPSNLGLEEVEFDHAAQVWHVTIGFSRPWDAPLNPLAAIQEQLTAPRRSYKVVNIHNLTGEVLSVKNRETKPWAESA